MSGKKSIENILTTAARKATAIRAARLSAEHIFALVGTQLVALLERTPGIETAGWKFEQTHAFECRLQVGEETLVIFLHPEIIHAQNVIPANAESYVKEDLNRLLCGMILVYTFRTESIQQNELDNPGFLLARIFINSEKHFYIEGRKPMSFLMNRFEEYEMTAEMIEDILLECISYSLQFHFYPPSFEDAFIISLGQKEMIESSHSNRKAAHLGFLQNKEE